MNSSSNGSVRTRCRPLLIEPDDTEEIRQRNRLEELLPAEYGITLQEQGNELVALCPFHDDEDPSLSINVAKQVWHCFACDLGGDVFKFVMRKEGLSFREAKENLAKRQPQQFSNRPPLQKVAPPPPTVDLTKEWEKCVDDLTEEQLQGLAQWRKFTPETCRWLKSEKLIGTHNKGIAFPNKDDQGIVRSIHCRIGADGGNGKAKWCYDPPGNPVWPLIIGTPQTATSVMAFESQWDALAVMDRLGVHRSGLNGTAVIVTRGATNAKLLSTIPISSKTPIYAFPQNDEPGERWMNQLEVAVAHLEVRRVGIPFEYKDANEWLGTEQTVTAETLKARIEEASKNCDAKNPPEKQGSSDGGVAKRRNLKNCDATNRPQKQGDSASGVATVAISSSLKEKKKKKERKDARDEVLEKLQKEAQFFHTPDGTGYVTIRKECVEETGKNCDNCDGCDAKSEISPVLPSDSENPRNLELRRIATHCDAIPTQETLKILARPFRQHLMLQLARAGQSPTTKAIADLVAYLEAYAIREGPEIPVFVRVGYSDGAVYVDLTNTQWEVVEITANGWRVLKQSPVRFVRAPGMIALPRPVVGGDLRLLRPLINARDDNHWVLQVGWLVGALHPRGPYPLLALNGEQGTIKSFTTRLLKKVIDPCAVPIRSLPTTEREILITALNSHVQAYDNLSHLTDVQSDILCRLATGGGLTPRMLYTDHDEVFLYAKRPVVINGITDLVTRGDLQERSIILQLPTIHESERLEERSVDAQFQEVWPHVLGALCDAVSMALSKQNAVTLVRKPRMIDFVQWVVAAEPALPWEPGTFLRCYEQANLAAMNASLEGNPLVQAIVRFLASIKQDQWQGSPTELYQALQGHVDASTRFSKQFWPQTPNWLVNRLRRVAPQLRQVLFIDVQIGRGKDRYIEIRKLTSTEINTLNTSGDNEP